MSDRLSVRQAISAMLHADQTPTAIAKSLSCSRVLVYKVKKLIGEGKTLERAIAQRKSPILTPRVRQRIKKKVAASPTKSLT